MQNQETEINELKTERTYYRKILDELCGIFDLHSADAYEVISAHVRLNLGAGKDYQSLIQSLKDALKGYQLTTESEILATINDITTDYIKLVEDCKQMTNEYHSFVEERQSCEQFTVTLKAIAMNVNALKTNDNEKVVDHLLVMIEEETRKLR